MCEPMRAIFRIRLGSGRTLLSFFRRTILLAQISRLRALSSGRSRSPSSGERLSLLAFSTNFRTVLALWSKVDCLIRREDSANSTAGPRCLVFPGISKSNPALIAPAPE